jgi:hypothetical protein
MPNLKKNLPFSLFILFFILTLFDRNLPLGMTAGVGRRCLDFVRDRGLYDLLREAFLFADLLLVFPSLPLSLFAGFIN